MASFSYNLLSLWQRVLQSIPLTLCLGSTCRQRQWRIAVFLRPTQLLLLPDLRLRYVYSSLLRNCFRTLLLASCTFV
ncbi:hypothetical protein Hanom_Chr09g00869871 [Helianthus anomalus]